MKNIDICREFANLEEDQSGGYHDYSKIGQETVFGDIQIPL